MRHARLTEDDAAASVRAHLTTDLEDARRAGALDRFETPLALRLVSAMAMEFLGELAESPREAPMAAWMVEAILRALRVAPDEAAAITARVSAAGLTEAPPD